MRLREAPILFILVAAAATSSVRPEERYTPPALIGRATAAAHAAEGSAPPAQAAPASPTTTSAAPPAQAGPPPSPAPTSAAPAEGASAPGPAGGGAGASTGFGGSAAAQAEGAAVLKQILKDKEDLIQGKRFTYDPGGRRDPFRSLLEQVAHFKGPRPKGISGMLIGEIDLQGVVKQKDGNVAFLRGSDNKGYFVRVGDELYDGRIISIDADSGTVTFRQRVDDPRLIKPYRDVVKGLSTGSEEEAQ